MKKGNIVSMAVQLGIDGNIYCEFAELPFEEIEKVFKNKYEASLIKTIHTFMNKKFKESSISLEKEMQAVTATIVK